MRWMVKLGLIDIATEVSLLSSHSALPHEGHMDPALHIMAYLVYTTTHACVRIQPIQTLTMSSFQLWIGNNSNVKLLNPFLLMPQRPWANQSTPE